MEEIGGIAIPQRLAINAKTHGGLLKLENRGNKKQTVIMRPGPGIIVTPSRAVLPPLASVSLEVQVGEETVVRSDGGLCIAAEATPHKTIEVDISSEPVTLTRKTRSRGVQQGVNLALVLLGLSILLGNMGSWLPSTMQTFWSSPTSADGDIQAVSVILAKVDDCFANPPESQRDECTNVMHEAKEKLYTVIKAIDARLSEDSKTELNEPASERKTNERPTDLQRDRHATTTTTRE